jgi:hypothetical protein
METLIYILTLFITFLGLLIGIILSNIAIEEITRVSKYLKYLNITIIPLIVLMASYNINKIFSIIFTCLTLAMLIIFRDRYNESWTYSCMGAIFFVSTISKEVLHVAILIIVYGISAATIEASILFKKKTNEHVSFAENVQLVKKIFNKYAFYLLVGIIFFAVFALLFRNI